MIASLLATVMLSRMNGFVLGAQPHAQCGANRDSFWVRLSVARLVIFASVAMQSKLRAQTFGGALNVNSALSSTFTAGAYVAIITTLHFTDRIIIVTPLAIFFIRSDASAAVFKPMLRLCSFTGRRGRRMMKNKWKVLRVRGK